MECIWPIEVDIYLILYIKHNKKNAISKNKPKNGFALMIYAEYRSYYKNKMTELTT